MVSRNFRQIKEIEQANKKTPYRIDLAGQRFGKLTVIEYSGKQQCGKQFKTIWLCKCDCGNEKLISTGDLQSGHTTSCGCYHKEMVGALNRKHNLSNKCGRLYPLWKSIKYRCYCETAKDYPRYGGRGITMCDEWKNNFESFYEWAIRNGYKEEKTDKGLNILTIDRIDVNGNYEPSNCRFVTNEVQSFNKRNSLTDEERSRVCPVCNKVYQVTQRNGNKTCSKECGQKLRLQTRKEKHEELSRNI